MQSISMPDFGVRVDRCIFVHGESVFPLRDLMNLSHIAFCFAGRNGNVLKVVF